VEHLEGEQSENLSKYISATAAVRSLLIKEDETNLLKLAFRHNVTT
jgi:hypothetical protein